MSRANEASDLLIVRCAVAVEPLYPLQQDNVKILIAKDASVVNTNITFGINFLFTQSPMNVFSAVGVESIILKT